MGSTRLEVERLKGLLKTMSELFNSSMSNLRAQMTDVKTQTIKNKLDFTEELCNVKVVTELHDKHIIQQTKDQSQIEIEEIKRNLTSKDEQIETLTNENASKSSLLNEYKTENENLSQSIDEFNQKIKSLEEKLLNATVDKEKAVIEVRDKLTNEHKTAMESMRQRYKLMTSIERSPSEQSLEKIERCEYIEKSNHESILLQTKEDLANEKELAIKSALERERARNDMKLSGNLYFSSSPKSPTTSQDFFKRILEEKEKQLDALRESEVMLLRENNRLKETIQSLADSEVSQISLLKNQFDELHYDKFRLAQELEIEKSRRVEMEKSVTAIKSAEITEMATSSADTSKSHSDKSSQSSSKLNVCFSSVSKGDQVLVVWNSVHEQYTIVQYKVSSTLFALN